MWRQRAATYSGARGCTVVSDRSGCEERATTARRFSAGLSIGSGLSRGHVRLHASDSRRGPGCNAVTPPSGALNSGGVHTGYATMWGPNVRSEKYNAPHATRALRPRRASAVTHRTSRNACASFTPSLRSVHTVRRCGEIAQVGPHRRSRGFGANCYGPGANVVRGNHWRMYAVLRVSVRHV